MKERSGTADLPSRLAIDAAAGDPIQLNEHLSQLAASAGSGDLSAVDTLLYAIVSLRLAEPGIRRVLIEPDDIDEVEQDVLVAVAEKAGSFRGDSRFTTWLNSVGRNKALEFVRRRRSPSQTPEDVGDATRISSLVANHVAVHELLAKVPETYRRPVTMRDIDGMSYAEIASSLDLNLNTVKSQISRGRALLASCAAEIN